MMRCELIMIVEEDGNDTIITNFMVSRYAYQRTTMQFLKVK